MQSNSNFTFYSSSNLTSDDYRELTALQSLCEQADRIAFKLELDFKLAQGAEPGKDIKSEFFCRCGEELVGYIGVNCFGSEEPEISGMTHPDYRRMGIFKRLHTMVHEELTRRGVQQALLLCDSRAEAGLAFIRDLGAPFEHAEREMALEADKPVLACGAAIELTPVKTDREGSHRAEADGRTVGSVRLELENGMGGLYAVEVLPELRGFGYGKGLVCAAVEKLRKEGAGRIRLQVYADNYRAQHVYKSCGFVEEDTMEYYLLKIT